MESDHLDGGVHTEKQAHSHEINQIWLIKHRWLVIGIIGMALLFIEFFESSALSFEVIHLVEFAIFFLFLAAIGALIEWIVRIYARQNRMYRLLDHKHRLAQEVIEHVSWDDLSEQLVKYPAVIAPIDEARLYLAQTSDSFYEADAWAAPGGEMKIDRLPRSCARCSAHLSANMTGPLRCEVDHQAQNGAQADEVYCLPIRYSGADTALLRFRVRPGETLSPDQADVLKNLSNEFALAIRAGQDHKRVVELHDAETTLAERRKVSHFLHDSLGQNLGFLYFKLDQLLAEENLLSKDVLMSDLERMRSAAQEANSIVRGFLETSQPGTLPSLSNLLIEHGKSAARRGNYQIRFNVHGVQSEVPPEIQRAVFFVYIEALNNIEKHARATEVEVQIEWGEVDLTVSVSDNGVGFQPGQVDRAGHFGLSIMEERMAVVNGEINLASNGRGGTQVVFSVPLPRKKYSR